MLEVIAGKTTVRGEKICTVLLYLWAMSHEQGFLSRLRDAFIHASKYDRVPDQELDSAVAAQIVRKTVLDMCQYGAVGSDELLPSEDTHDRTNLPALLQYSPWSRECLAKLYRVLHSPQEFSLMTFPTNIFEVAAGLSDLDGESGDVMKTEAEGKEEYHFSNLSNEDTMNFSSGIHSAMGVGGEVEHVVVTRELEPHQEVWQVILNYLPEDFGQSLRGGGRSLEQKVAKLRGGYSSISQLDNYILQQFWFVPLDPGREVLRDMIPPVMNSLWKPFLSRGKEERVGERFRGWRYQMRVGDFVKKNGRFLTGHDKQLAEKRKDRDLVVVKLGVTEIGNLSYHVFSTMDQTPLAQENEPRLYGQPRFEAS